MCDDPTVRTHEKKMGGNKHMGIYVLKMEEGMDTWRETPAETEMKEWPGPKFIK